MTSEELLVIDDIEIPVLRKKSLKNLYIHADPLILNPVTCPVTCVQ